VPKPVSTPPGASSDGALGCTRRWDRPGGGKNLPRSRRLGSGLGGGGAPGAPDGGAPGDSGTGRPSGKQVRGFKTESPGRTRCGGLSLGMPAAARARGAAMLTKPAGLFRARRNTRHWPFDPGGGGQKEGGSGTGPLGPGSGGRKRGATVILFPSPPDGGTGGGFCSRGPPPRGGGQGAGPLFRAPAGTRLGRGGEEKHGGGKLDYLPGPPLTSDKRGTGQGRWGRGRHAGKKGRKTEGGKKGKKRETGFQPVGSNVDPRGGFTPKKNRGEGSSSWRGGAGGRRSEAVTCP